MPVPALLATTLPLVAGPNAVAPAEGLADAPAGGFADAMTLALLVPGQVAAGTPNDPGPAPQPRAPIQVPVPESVSSGPSLQASAAPQEKGAAEPATTATDHLPAATPPPSRPGCGLPSRTDTASAPPPSACARPAFLDPASTPDGPAAARPAATAAIQNGPIQNGPIQNGPPCPDAHGPAPAPPPVPPAPEPQQQAEATAKPPRPNPKPTGNPHLDPEAEPPQDDGDLAPTPQAVMEWPAPPPLPIPPPVLQAPSASPPEAAFPPERRTAGEPAGPSPAVPNAANTSTRPALREPAPDGPQEPAADAAPSLAGPSHAMARPRPDPASDGTCDGVSSGVSNGTTHVVVPNPKDQAPPVPAGLAPLPSPHSPPEAVSATPAPSRADSIHPSLPPGPATQLGGAFVALPNGRDGTPQTLVIRLEPRELGRVQIRLERSAEGPARVDLSVERPDTLMLLMQDRTGLDQALTQAGIPQDGRTLTFSLNDPGAGNPGHSPGTGGPANDGARSGGQPGQNTRNGWNGTGDDPPDRRRRTAHAWARAGVDITA